MRAFLSCGLTAMSILAGAAAAAAATPAGSVECSARSGAATPRVVELYTSEGCDSCPPADRWLSGLRGRDDVIALAFHVDYWDRLGWVDRFGSPAHTERQQRLSRAMGSRFVYTPQVLLDGDDVRSLIDALPRGNVAVHYLTESTQNVGTTEAVPIDL